MTAPLCSVSYGQRERALLITIMSWLFLSVMMLADRDIARAQRIFPRRKQGDEYAACRCRLFPGGASWRRTPHTSRAAPALPAIANAAIDDVSWRRLSAGRRGFIGPAPRRFRQQALELARLGATGDVPTRAQYTTISATTWHGGDARLPTPMFLAMASIAAQ